MHIHYDYEVNGQISSSQNSQNNVARCSDAVDVGGLHVRLAYNLRPAFCAVHVELLQWTRSYTPRVSGVSGLRVCAMCIHYELWQFYQFFFLLLLLFSPTLTGPISNTKQSWFRRRRTFISGNHECGNQTRMHQLDWCEICVTKLEGIGYRLGEGWRMWVWETRKWVIPYMWNPCQIDIFMSIFKSWMQMHRWAHIGRSWSIGLFFD